MVALCQCLQPHVTATTLRPLSQMVWAILVMSGRVTMLGISRWAGSGGSYRTVQRVFSQVLPWAMRFWVFFHQHVDHPDAVYLLAGDAVVATKAGKHTHGLDRFFSRRYGKPVPGLAFFTWSVVSTPPRPSCPLRVAQVVRSAAEKAASQAKADAKKPTPATAKRRPGRPQGSKHTPKADVTLTPELWRITGMLSALLQLSAGCVSLTYLVLDAHFGHNNARHMARRSNLHLISKLRGDAAVYFPYAGPYAGRGPRRQYGRKVDYTKLPETYLKETTVAGHIHTRVSQAPLLPTECAHPLNVVSIVKTNLHTQAQAHVILFSRDLTLADASRVDDYGVRFQLACNFREATQDWGLEDFMNVTPTGVTKAANLSLFMVNVAYRLQADGRQRDPDYRILDLKADCRGYTYVEATIKMLPEKPAPVL
jgi:putative transposase